MKKLVIVEIDVPNGDESGFQTYQDTVKTHSMCHCIEALSIALDSLKRQGIDIADAKVLKDNEYYQYILEKNEIVNNCTARGYIDDENNVMMFDESQYEFTNEGKIVK